MASARQTLARKPASTSRAHFDLSPEDRIGPPLASARGKVARRALLVLIAIGGGWAWANGHVTLPEGALAKLTALTASLTSTSPRAPGNPDAPANNSPPAGEQAARLAPIDTPALVQRVTPPPQVTVMNAAAKAAEQSAANAPPSPQKSDEELSAPRLSSTDPTQMRASAAGLSPDLSRAVLSRLTADDFVNAAKAIQTALAETADDAAFVWPRQRKPEQALFRVHFVPGAGPDCRRYVVTVTKDGWSATAPPMERCGAQRGRAAQRG